MQQWGWYLGWPSVAVFRVIDATQYNISGRCGSTIGNNSFLAMLNELKVLFAAGDIPVDSADSDLQ